MKPCIKCGASDRYASGDCRPCAIKRATAYVEKNKEWRKAYRAEYYAKDKKSAITATRKWCIENREHCNIYSRAYLAKRRAQNPEIYRIYTLNRKYRIAGGKLSPDIAAKLFKRQRGKCACGCSQPLGNNFHRDHIMPLALGGTNTDDNIQLLRQRCNNQKHAKHPVDFMQSRGFLL